jgi:hypothetical protein
MPEPWNAVDYHIIDVKYNRPLRNNLGVNTTNGFTYSIADMKPDEIKISDLIDNIWTFNRVSVFEPNGIDRNDLQIMATPYGPYGPYEHEVVDEGSIVRETIGTHTNYKLSPYVVPTTAPPLADLDSQLDDLERRFNALPSQHHVLPSEGDQATGQVNLDVLDGLDGLERRFNALFLEDRNIDGGGRRHMKRKSKRRKSKRRKSKRRKSKRRKSNKRRNKTKRR